MAGARAAVGAIRVANGVAKVADKANDVKDVVDAVQEGQENQKRSEQDMHVIRTFNRVDYLAARQDPNQRAWELCHEQLGNATVTFSAPAEGGE